MQIYRHCYSESEWKSTDYPFLNDLNSFGFCLRDGTDFKGDESFFDGNNCQMRWKQDSNNKTYCQFRNTTHSPEGKSSLSYSSIIFSNNSSKTFGGNTMYSTGFVHCVFLPLKNNGFLTFFGSNVDNVGNPLGYPLKLGYYSPTPRLYGTHYYFSNGNSLSMAASTIGIPPSYSNTNWIYIYSNPPTNYNLGSSYLPKIDYGNGIVTTLPYLSDWNYDENHIENAPTYNNTYTNINQNVCSLIKMPYDNQYINGVYLLATSPQSLKECTFFSFNGRNFLNLIGNYVFELQST